MDLGKLSMGDKIVGGAGIVLLIDLLFFPWHNVDLGPFGGSVSRSALESPNGFWGVLALLLTIVVVLGALLPKLTSVEVPDMPISLGDAVFFGACAVVAILVLKLVLETEALGFGSYLGILLAAGMAYGGFLVRSEGGERDAASPGSTSPPPPA